MVRILILFVNSVSNFQPALRISVYSNTSDALAIGIATNGVSTADPFNGDIAEIVIYNTALSDAERITVENYLKNKYAL